MKKLIFILALIILTFSINSRVLATEQQSEVIIFEGKTYHFPYLHPLQPYLEKLEIKPEFRIEPEVITSGNWRGYMATWEISENKLYLKDIESYIGDKKITIHDISDEFKKKSEKIFAYWYSGPIFIGDNDPMFIFGCTTRIDILNGIVEKITKVDEKMIQEWFQNKDKKQNNP